MSPTTDHNDDDIALAGEYALHLLNAEDRRAFEARMLRDPMLRILVREWDEGLVTLADEIEPVTPPRAVLSRVESVLFSDRKERAERPGGWLLGGIFGVLAASAVALALVVVLPQTRFEPTGPVYSAQLAAEDQSLVVQARFDPDANALQLDRVEGGALPGRVLELWLIAEGATAPVSLGVLPDDQTATVSLTPDLVAALAGGTLAISDEPPGGSPTGQPTGAVLAAGQVTEI